MRIIHAGIAGAIAMLIWSFCSHTVLLTFNAPPDIGIQRTRRKAAFYHQRLTCAADAWR